jgi:hypothetical protein
MKAQAYLDLTKLTFTAQQDYFKAKREGAYNAKQLLIESKKLEAQCRAVIKEGRLEPDDEPTATKEDQKQMDFLIDESVTDLQLDLLGNEWETDLNEN